MDKILFYPVMYLDDGDFQDDGNLKRDKLVLPNNVQNDKNVVVMVQAAFCGHCTTAKPAFQQFADQYQNNVICATIQADGDTESEKKLGKRIEQIVPTFQGFPDYCLFVKGKRVDKQIKSRDIRGLIEFANL